MPARSAVRQTAAPTRRAASAVAAARGKAVAAPHSTQVLRSRLGNDMAQAVVERLRSAAVQRPAANAAAAPVNAAKLVTPAAAAPERAPAAPSPEEAVAPVVTAVHQRATTASRHGPPAAAIASAQAAAVQPLTEQTRAAATQTVGAMDAVQLEALRRGAFKGQLRQAIRDATPQPKTPSEAEAIMEGGARQASGVLRGQLTEQRSAAAGPMASAAAAESPASAQAVPPATALRVEPLGARPGAVPAGPVVPAPLSPQQLDYRADRAPADAALAQAGVSPDRLSGASDPVFAPAADARGAAERHEASAQARYRAGEAKEHAAARAGAELVIARGLDGLHAARLGKLAQVGGRQQGVVDKDAERRRQVAAEITAIKDSTKNDVALILAALESESVRLFEDGLKAAEAEYEAAFEDAKGGLGTWLTTWAEDWEAHIAQALAVARERYLARVDVAIETVADVVDAKVREAKRRVALGRKTVDERIAGLDAHLREAGLQARDAVAGDFDAMNAQIDERRDGLVAQLTQRYKDSCERMSAREQELRDANKTLWQRALDATVGVVKQILAFKAMLSALLGRAAGVVEDIVADPIGFLGNLVAGVMAGLKGFVANLASHLKKGLMDWLFGALAGAGLTMPETFDLKGVVSLVLQFLGLTYANFRARAVALIGEPVVQALEQAAEVFKVLVTEGVGGLWRFIKEKVAELKSMVLDGIVDFIREKVIVAGVTWIIGLLNPASAFFKACKAIYDIGVFFVQRGQQLATLVSAVVASMAAIAKGNLSAAAAFVENALARAVPVAIGFLAGLLGLSDPSKPVQALMKKAQAPVNKAIDGVIRGAVGLVKAAGRVVLGKKDERDEPQQDDPQKAAKIAAGLADLDADEGRILKGGGITLADAQIVARRIKRAHPVFTSIVVVDAGDRLAYRYTASPPVVRESVHKRSDLRLELVKIEVKAGIGARALSANTRMPLIAPRKPETHSWEAFELGAKSLAFDTLIRQLIAKDSEWSKAGLIKSGKRPSLKDIPLDRKEIADAMPGKNQPAQYFYRSLLKFEGKVVGSSKPDLIALTSDEIIPVEVTLRSDWSLEHVSSAERGRRMHKQSQAMNLMANLQPFLKEHPQVKVRLVFISDREPDERAVAVVEELANKTYRGQISKIHWLHF
ncbi:hypothetical protein QTH90_21025 [Variovorax sp. J2P1-59]|uniref:phage tail protein n=1 Tax=Variovorax flavidus TaxID=3053501 RepID=UPI002575C26F|nr:hypothetical protein [Variovorax sp. J2P1-59]MDM0076905.1 hypothetical protein [Variovorax sp. J2P1-59]